MTFERIYADYDNCQNKSYALIFEYVEPRQMSERLVEHSPVADVYYSAMHLNNPALSERLENEDFTLVGYGYFDHDDHRIEFPKRMFFCRFPKIKINPYVEMLPNDI